MSTKEELKERVIEAIEKRSTEIREIGETILRHPEMGFKEVKTAALVEEKFRSLGLSYQKGVALTGVVADLPGRAKKMRLAIMGELDSILVPSNPNADPLTGAAHACGHNASIAGMVGAAMGLIDSGAMKELDGDVSLMAVPAEELVELEYRHKLRQEGKLVFLAGKQEFIRLGVLEDVDMVMMFHLKEMDPIKKVLIGATHNGVMAKFIRYKGKESHAGGAPHLGINALNAAMIGLLGIHAQRETFRDEDCVRVHPIITKGGDLVNVVPADVRIETFVRGRTVEAMQDANQKVNRALRAGAMAIGAQVEILDLPGYLPSICDARLDQLFAANMAALLGAEAIGQAGHQTGSTDIGDVSHLMPALHAYIKAGKGYIHTEDFVISDPRLAYIETAKGLALTAVDLLWAGAREGLSIKKDYHPKYSQDQYLKVLSQLSQGVEKGGEKPVEDDGGS
ncbi:MAG: amidohydrolase [Deltaproteobacteria bacterium]|nr:amidohydrolase [Deltaproteobacteria bacterium]